MLCPRCENVFLIESDRQGVLIDYCKTCRGLWLDRGELEKLLAGEARASDAPARRRDLDDSDDDHRRGKRKRGTLTDLLGDLFD